MADVLPHHGGAISFSAGVFVVGGTFSIGAGLILSVVVVFISLCLGELAGMFPIAGGMYSLVRTCFCRVRCRGSRCSTTSFRGVVIPASIALGMVRILARTCSPASDYPTTVIADRVVWRLPPLLP